MQNCVSVALILSVSGLGWCTGPVYKTKVEVESSTETQAEEQTTQTVYGFLDFTTTIGNTVMVFSPQSQKGQFTAGSYPRKTFCAETIMYLSNLGSLTVS